MPSGSALLSVLLTCTVVALHTSQSHRQMALHTDFRDDDDYPRIAEDVMASADESSDRTNFHKEAASSSSSDEEDEERSSGGAMRGPLQVQKRRRGPTLSVVNPLEILRQRLMLDLARRRIHENQQQIVANAQLLEDIGKRSSSGRRPYKE